MTVRGLASPADIPESALVAPHLDGEVSVARNCLICLLDKFGQGCNSHATSQPSAAGTTQASREGSLIRESPGSRSRGSHFLALSTPRRSARRAARRGSARGRSPAKPAEPSGDREQQPDRDEDPGLGTRVAVGRDRPRRLAASDHAVDEVVHLAEVPVAGTSGSRGRRPTRSARASQSCATAERCSLNSKNAFAIACVHAWGSGSAATASSHAVRTLRPRRVDAGEVQRLLRREVAVEDRLGHARLAGDLGGGGAAVASSGRRRGRRCRARRRAAPRRRAGARVIPLRRRRALAGAGRPAERQSRDHRAEQRDPGGDQERVVEPVEELGQEFGLPADVHGGRRRSRPSARCPSDAADLAQCCSARAEPTPALSRATELHRRRGGRGHRHRHARRRRAASPGRGSRSVVFSSSARRGSAITATSDHPAAHEPARADPVGQLPGHAAPGG